MRLDGAAARACRSAAPRDPRHRRLRREPRAAARARDARGRHVLLRAAPGSTGDGLRLGLEAGGAGRAPGWTSLRSRDAGPAGAREPARLRAARAAVRTARGGDERATASATRRRPGRRSTRRAVDGAPAAGAGLVPVTEDALGAARARAQRGGDGRGRGGAPERPCGASAGDVDGGDGGRRDHDAGRARDRRERARGGRRVRLRRATRAASRPAATPAAWRPRWCSAGSRRARRSGRAREPRFGSGEPFTVGARGGAAAGRPRDARSSTTSPTTCSRRSTLPEARAGHEAFLAEIEVRSEPRASAAEASRRHSREGRAAVRARRRHADGCRPAPGRRLWRRAAGGRRPLPRAWRARCAA